MRICRYALPGSGPRIGLVHEGRVHDLTQMDPEAFGSFTSTIHCDDLAGRLAGFRPTSDAGMPWSELDASPEPDKPHLLPPIDAQEVWAAGVTYLRSREARMGESPQGGTFYDRVYNAARPELFFKGTPHRVVGPNAPVRIRPDARWSVPEPELALIVDANGVLAGFTIGNDMSSRDIEGENPLYLPQAKVYMGSCALGPAMVPAALVEDPRGLRISMSISRKGSLCFEGTTTIARMKRSFEDLISYLFREQEFPSGVILLTGTGIVPSDDFTLLPGDLVEITVPEIGTLRNPVIQRAE